MPEEPVRVEGEIELSTAAREAARGLLQALRASAADGGFVGAGSGFTRVLEELADENDEERGL